MGSYCLISLLKRLNTLYSDTFSTYKKAMCLIPWFLQFWQIFFLGLLILFSNVGLLVSLNGRGMDEGLLDFLQVVRGRNFMAVFVLDIEDVHHLVAFG